MRSTVLGGKWYSQKDADLNILSKTHLTTVNTAGGAFVPEDFKPELITLLEDFGVARQVIGVTAMARDTLTMPRIDSVFTTNWTGEAVAITEDTLDTSNIELVARKHNQGRKNLFEHVAVATQHHGEELCSVVRY